MQPLENNPVQPLVTRRERLHLEIAALNKELDELYEEFHNLEAKIQTLETTIGVKETDRAFAASQFSEEDERLGHRAAGTQEAITSSGNVIDLTEQENWHSPSERMVSRVQDDIGALLKKQQGFKQRKGEVDRLIDEKRDALAALRQTLHSTVKDEEGSVIPFPNRINS